MSKNLKMCLYLDVDMLALNDIRELFSLDMTDKVAGVIEIFNIQGLYAKNPQDENFYFKDFYFNAGFLLINL